MQTREAKKFTISFGIKNASLRERIISVTFINMTQNQNITHFLYT